VIIKNASARVPPAEFVKDKPCLRKGEKSSSRYCMMVMLTTFVGWGQRITTLRDNDTKIPYPIKDMILAPAVNYGVMVYTKGRTYGFLGSFLLHLFSTGPSKMKTRVFVYRS
jgi:hypothetical protein